MGRRPGVPGTWGRISTRRLESGAFAASAWYIDALAGKGTRVQRSGVSSAEAVRRLKRELYFRASEQLARGRNRIKKVSLIELCQMYLQRRSQVDAFREMSGENVPKATFHEQRRLVRNVIMPSMLADLPAAAVRVSDISDFYWARASTRAEARNAMVELRKIFDLAQELNLSPTNPARDFRGMLPRRRVTKHAPGAEELQTLLQVVRAYRGRPQRAGPQPSRLLEDAIVVILGTSARIGEAMGLRWEDVDLDARVPTVTIRGTVIEGSGVPKAYQPFGKTEQATRTIPIPDVVAATLRRRAAERRGGNPFVFHTSTGAVSGPQDVHRALRRVRAWSARNPDVPTIAEEMIPRSLRRAVATAVYNAESLDAAARTLGHAETGVTEKHYAVRDSVAPDMRHITGKLLGE